MAKAHSSVTGRLLKFPLWLARYWHSRLRRICDKRDSLRAGVHRKKFLVEYNTIRLGVKETFIVRRCQFSFVPEFFCSFRCRFATHLTTNSPLCCMLIFPSIPFDSLFFSSLISTYAHVSSVYVVRTHRVVISFRKQKKHLSAIENNNSSNDTNSSVTNESNVCTLESTECSICRFVCSQTSAHKKLLISSRVKLILETK